MAAPEMAQGVALYESGVTQQQLGVMLGFSTVAIGKMLRRHGCVIRPRGYHLNPGTSADKRAQNALHAAIRKGIVRVPDRCERCGCVPEPRKDGASRIHGHHDDYSKPLAVRWLCSPCHREWHRKHKAAGHLPPRPKRPRGVAGRNKRAPRMITHDGQTRPLSVWALTIGIHPTTLAKRIDTGWSIGAALTPKA